MALGHSPSIVTDGLVLCLDAANKKSYSQNYHPNPTDIYEWYISNSGTSNNCSSITRDDIASPVGYTPLKMVTSGNDSHIRTYNLSKWNLATARSGQTWTVSVWAKASVATFGQIFIFEANSSGSYIQASAKTISITTEWQRFDYTYTFINASTSYIQTRLDGADTFVSSVTIWWDGLQVEPSSSISDFTSLYKGENIVDLSGNGNNGTLTNGPTYNNSNGGSLSFDGVNDYVRVLDNDTLDFDTGNFTVSMWFNRNISATTNLRLLSKGASSDTGDAANAGFSFFGNNSSISFAVNPTATRTIITAAAYSLGEWMNVVGILERGVSMRTYKNTTLVASTTAPSGSVSGTSNLIIGAHANGTGLWWTGNITQVSIYNRALTESEVQQNFNALRGRFGI